MCLYVTELWRISCELYLVYAYKVINEQAEIHIRAKNEGIRWGRFCGKGRAGE